VISGPAVLASYRRSCFKLGICIPGMSANRHGPGVFKTSTALIRYHHLESNAIPASIARRHNIGSLKGMLGSNRAPYIVDRAMPRTKNFCKGLFAYTRRRCHVQARKSPMQCVLDQDPRDFRDELRRQKGETLPFTQLLADTCSCSIVQLTSTLPEDCANDSSPSDSSATFSA
jgi:hypothetical protein